MQARGLNPKAMGNKRGTARRSRRGKTRHGGAPQRKDPARRVLWFRQGERNRPPREDTPPARPRRFWRVDPRGRRSLVGRRPRPSRSRTLTRLPSSCTLPHRAPRARATMTAATLRRAAPRRPRAPRPHDHRARAAQEEAKSAERAEWQQFQDFATSVAETEAEEEVAHDATVADEGERSSLDQVSRRRLRSSLFALRSSCFAISSTVFLLPSSLFPLRSPSSSSFAHSSSLRGGAACAFLVRGRRGPRARCVDAARRAVVSRA